MTENIRQVKPLRITVGMLKGGVGRSTVSVHVALRIAAITGERVLLIDADPKNLTTWNWCETAGEDWPELVTVVDWSTSTGLSKRVRDSGFRHVVIDTGNDTKILRQALHATNVLLIPSGSTENDERRIRPTLNEAAEVLENMPEDHELHAAVLLSKTRAGTRSRTETRQALEDLGIPVLDAEVPLAERYAQASGTVPTDLGVFTAVVDELIERTQQ